LEKPDINGTPVIGIVSGHVGDMGNSEEYARANNFTSYISKNYAQTLWGVGAMVVPIPYDRDFEELKPLLEKLNGIMLIGGGGSSKLHFVKSRLIY